MIFQLFRPLSLLLGVLFYELCITGFKCQTFQGLRKLSKVQNSPTSEHFHLQLIGVVVNICFPVCKWNGLCRCHLCVYRRPRSLTDPTCGNPHMTCATSQYKKSRILLSRLLSGKARDEPMNLALIQIPLYCLH